eukprot:4977997-Pleurochrysis_carterae.AAC.1
MKESRAEEESVESTPHSPAKLVRPAGPDHSSACRKAEEGGQTEALEQLMDAPPSLPPSPPPMHPNEAPEESGGAGP